MFLQIRHGRLHEIELPSQQYFLEIEDSEIASIDSYSSEAQALQVGRSKVFLRDRNVDPSVTGVRVPQATFNVALPAFIHLVLLPHRHWSVLVEDQHVIAVEVFDRYCVIAVFHIQILFCWIHREQLYFFIYPLFSSHQVKPQISY